MAESSKRKRDVAGDTSEQSKLPKIDDDATFDTLDLQGLKRLILGFERKITKNQQMRIKFHDQPEKFMDSEIDLDDEIKKMHLIATAPELYEDFVKLGAVPSLVGLLSHENADISIATVDLLHEVLDIDELDEVNDAGVQALVDSLLSNQLLEVLVQNISRFDESQQEDAQAVFNSLAILESLVEFQPTIANLVTEKTSILTFLLTRIKVKQFDENKLYASEILSIILQNSKENQKKIGLTGLDTLLLTIAAYKKHDPASAEEEEMIENIFNCLCSCLLLPENRPLFLKAEGLELMLILSKNKKLKVIRRSALKVLSFALTRNAPNCKRFVNVLGLKTLFAAFMKKGKGKSAVELGEEEHVISSIASLLINLDLESDEGQRVLAKFKENDYEKVERLVEMHERYYKKVEAADQDIKRKRLDALDDDSEEMFYLERLDAGLFALQLVDLVIAVVASDTVVKKAIMKLFDMRNIEVAQIRSVVVEYANSMGDISDPEEREKEKNHIMQRIKDFL